MQIMYANNPWFVAVALNTALIAIAFLLPKKLLTPAGYGNAWVLGVIVWGVFGWQGYATVLFYFLVGSAATKVGMAKKEAYGIAEARGGVRGPGNVWGSALTGTVCALVLLAVQLFNPAQIALWQPLLSLGFVASLSTKLSDTMATEIGKAYGRRTFLITTLQPVPRGTEGAVSLEGTLAGIVASAAIAAVAWSVGLISPLGVALCGVAALGATTIESLIGATVEEKLDWLTHDLVNIINTSVGALLAIALGWLLQQ